ncbi:MAG: hypothetical protein IPP25_19795 [Saprospiraceae bacterium]|nr:hypothetical protein [Candidatus Opimibacter skivensis]
MARHRPEFREYLDTYNGDSKGEDEVIAPGRDVTIFRQKLEDNRHRIENGVTRSGLQNGPQWLIDIVLEDMASRS